MDRREIEGKLSLLLTGDVMNKEQISRLRGYLERMQDEGLIQEILYLGNMTRGEIKKRFKDDAYISKQLEKVNGELKLMSIGWNLKKMLKLGYTPEMVANL